MVKEFFLKLISRAKMVAKALKAKIIALTHKFMLTVPVEKFLIPCIPSDTRDAMNKDKRFRLTKDHSPIFSLFTFFLDRQ